MSFKIAILICLVLMGLMALVTYYAGKKMSKSVMKYIPSFSFAIGVLFFYIKLNYLPYELNSFDSIYDMIAIILLIIVFGISLLEAFIIDIVENTKLFERFYASVRKAIK